MDSDTNWYSPYRTYDRGTSAVFFKTREQYGGLSNMAAGFPLCINGVIIHTSEALYQACRFPHKPEIQRQIINERNPFSAKMCSRSFINDTRPDWDSVRISVMRWCLRIKLTQHWNTFSGLLMETGNRPIVEQSRKDDFWGAKVDRNGKLVGINVLGRLLMELREEIRSESRKSSTGVPPLNLSRFLLLGEPIAHVIGSTDTDSLYFSLPVLKENSEEST